MLHKYTSQINRSKYPQQTAIKIANDLNKRDPFNNYLVSFELGSKRYIIEKFEIRGMNRWSVITWKKMTMAKRLSEN